MKPFAILQRLGLPHSLRRHAARVGALELAAVRNAASIRRFRPFHWAILVVNFLGNGWVYLPIALAVILVNPARVWLLVLTAAMAAIIAHAIYRPLKGRIGRLRPFEKDPSLLSHERVLDRYSFPSGHCMSLATVLVPIMHELPAAMPGAVAALSVLGFTRLAAAHHYPSDVVAGMGLGVAVALPLSLLLLPR